MSAQLNQEKSNPHSTRSSSEINGQFHFGNCHIRAAKRAAAATETGCRPFSQQVSEGQDVWAQRTPVIIPGWTTTVHRVYIIADAGGRLDEEWR